MRSCFLRKFVFDALCYLSTVSLTIPVHVIGLRLEALKDDYLLVLGMSPSRIGWERLSYFLKTTRCVVTCSAHTH